MAKRAESVPQQLQPIYAAIVAITDEVAREHLDDEYAQLCRRLAAALARKRPSPLLAGKVHTWAAGIVYAIGSVNFLFDKTQTPSMTADELSSLFGISKSTAAAKAKTIKDLFRMQTMDPRWYRPSKLDSNPLAWMIEVDGFIVDVRYAPRDLQEEALRRGLIPYLPQTTRED